MAQDFAADPNAVRQFVIEAVEAGQRGLAERVAEAFGVSRPTAYNYLRALLEEGVITRLSPDRYELTAIQHAFHHEVAGLAEDVVWSSEIAPTLKCLPPNVLNILQYATTEMINNVIDHSGSPDVRIAVEATAAETTITVVDHGVGIFRKIASALDLEDDRQAVLELSKGKVTTDPDNHTGEGVFFSSRACDHFRILSRGVFFDHDARTDQDWILDQEAEWAGTSVAMTMRHTSQTELREVFDEYTTDTEDFRFDRTVVPVKLMQYADDQLVSRSQAKRLMGRFDRFRTVILDFADVPAIGQAFADEVFRVFPTRHPGVDVVAINTNEQVGRMVARANRDHS
ncbi:MAG TPA: DUF4325 domain-containing protein [Acidimicrobiia bacterium]